MLNLSQHTLRISMKVDGLQSVCQQLSEQVDSIPETIIQYLQLQSESPVQEINTPTIISEVYVEPHQGKVLSLAVRLNINQIVNTNIVAHSVSRLIPGAQVQKYSFSKSVIYFRMYKQSICGGACDCSCHSNYKFRTPLMLGNLLGSLFMRYNGSPLLRPKCEKITCQNRTGQSFQLTYCFPRWFLEMAIHLVAARTYTGSPMFGLEVRRRVAWGSEDSILKFALTGNTVGVKTLLGGGRFSMTDVDPNHGRSALYVSLRINTPTKISINS
jgi:hypothetical protein